MSIVEQGVFAAAPQKGNPRLWSNNEYMALLSALALTEIDEHKPKQGLAEFIDFFEHVLKDPHVLYPTIVGNLFAEINHHDKEYIFRNPHNVQEFVHKIKMRKTDLSDINAGRLSNVEHTRNFFTRAHRLFHDYVHYDYMTEQKPHR